MPHVPSVATLCFATVLLACNRGTAGDWLVPNDPAYARFPCDPHQESLFLLDMERAWAITKGSPEVVIGIIDWAIQADHPDLAGKLWTNPGEIPGDGIDNDGNGFVDDIHGWDFVDNDSTLEGQTQEHGTHVAGIIGAETNNGIGIAGMAPDCPMMFVKVGLEGVLRDGEIMARAIRYCVDNGARIICKNHGLSEHYPGWHVPVGGALKEACDYAYRKGVLIVSGTTSNDGRYCPAGFLAAYDSVMGTGASDIFGDVSDMFGGSLFNEVIAPGGDRSDGATNNKRSVYSAYSAGQEYAYSSGGCMATPHVVGLLALVLSHYPGLDVEQARQIVRNTAKSPLDQFDVRWGHGLIQPVKALSIPARRLATRPRLVGGISEAEGPSGAKSLLVQVRNAGVFDARVIVSLMHGGKVMAMREAIAVGFETTPVTFPSVGIPPASELSARLDNLGIARPPVFDRPPDVRLSIAPGDISLEPPAGRPGSLIARVRNSGSQDAPRVLVLLHQHEPAVPDRVGPPSRQLAARVIQVPARGFATAEFTELEIAGLQDLWVEIEDLAIGASHVHRAGAIARCPSASSPASSPGSVAHFGFTEAGGDVAMATGRAPVTARVIGATWGTDAAATVLSFDGRSARLEAPDHPELSGMTALRIDAKVKLAPGSGPVAPIAYKWLAGNTSASFGLAVLREHPYCLLRTTGGGFVEAVFEDLTLQPGQWHTVTLLYTGTRLTALLDGKPSGISRPAFGPVDHCPRPLLIGAATNKQGELVSFLNGALSELSVSVPETEQPRRGIPGTLETDRVVRVLNVGAPERLQFTLDASAECTIRVETLEGKGPIRMALDGPGRRLSVTLPAREGTWSGALDAGDYRLELSADARVAYRLHLTGMEDVWQDQLVATDRGAGARADYTAWLAPSRPGQAKLEWFDCSEGARILLATSDGSLQTVRQSGGVMGDSSVQSGGEGVWRAHEFTPGDDPLGIWLYYPSLINAAGDYAIRGQFTIHWRKPPDAVSSSLSDSPSMRALSLRVRGGKVNAADRARLYTEASDAGLRFMEALNEASGEHHRIYERWIVDTGAPRVYWGSDGQMLCARTFWQAHQRTGQERFGRMALGLARRVIAHQIREAGDPRHGALPYGFVGENETVSWGSSNNIQGKALYGLSQLAAWSGEPDLLEALRLNADYYARTQYENGRWPHFVERTPESVCGYPTAWGVSGLIIAYETLGDAKYLESAERGLAAFLEGMQSDGSIHCYCNHAGGEKEDNHAIRSSLTMLTPFALAFRVTGKREYRSALDNLHRFLTRHQRPEGAILDEGKDCVNLIYSQNWGPQGFCEAYEATGDRKFLTAGMRLADFLVRAQLTMADPHLDGAWTGSFNVAKGFPGGDMDDEGNLYDFYTSWGAAPIAYGLTTLATHCKP